MMSNHDVVNRVVPGAVIMDQDARIALRCGNGFPLLMAKQPRGQGAVVLYQYVPYFWKEGDAATVVPMVRNMLKFNGMWAEWSRPDVLVLETTMPSGAAQFIGVRAGLRSAVVSFNQTKDGSWQTTSANTGHTPATHRTRQVRRAPCANR